MPKASHTRTWARPTLTGEVPRSRIPGALARVAQHQSEIAHAQHLERQERLYRGRWRLHGDVLVLRAFGFALDRPVVELAHRHHLGVLQKHTGDDLLVLVDEGTDHVDPRAGHEKHAHAPVGLDGNREGPVTRLDPKVEVERRFGEEMRALQAAARGHVLSEHPALEV